MIRAGIYRHYKGGLYRVLCCATHTETEERGVVYISLTTIGLPDGTPAYRVNFRPLRGPSGFLTQVTTPHGTIDRFSFCGD